MSTISWPSILLTLRAHTELAGGLSMAFHRRLGFRVTREGAKGVEFTATLEELQAATPVLQPARGAGG